MIALQPDKAYHFLLVNCNDYKNGVSVILSSQCIKALANNFKQAKISLLLHSSMKDFFLNNPHINQIFCIDTTHNLIKELKRANIALDRKTVCIVKISINQDYKLPHACQMLFSVLSYS